MWLDQILQDLRFGARTLAKNPGFSAIAVLSLALGIMATTAMYSVIYGVVLNPFPYKDVDSLMSVKVWEPGQRGFQTYYSVDQFVEIAERSTIFEGVVASTISDVLWTSQGEPQRLRGNHGTFNTLQVMGVPPLIGRPYTPADAAPGAEPVCVLGYKFWQRQFGGDRGVLGRQLKLNGVVRTVVGVMPLRFMFRGADVYIPLAFHRGEAPEGVRFMHLLGRLKPGVTEAQAEADLHPIIEELKRREPTQLPDKWRVSLLSFRESFPSGLRDTLWILFGAVGILLLIACANVSNLLLSKFSARKKEMAVRASLGAGRSRLIRQLLTESLLLALAGGALGVALAFGGLKAILALAPPNTIPDESEVVINLPVLLFTVGVSMLTAVLFGLAPALHACRINLANPLKDTGRGLSGGGARQGLLRNSLVVAEVALSLVLLVGASLMIRTLIAMQSVDLGIRPDRLLTMRVPLSDQRYPDADRRGAFFRALLPRLASVPGVAAVGLNTGLHPFGGRRAPVVVTGGQADSRPVVIHEVNEDYTRAMDIALLQGRQLSETEVVSKRHVALVNQAFVQRYLSDNAAPGRMVRIPRLWPPNVQGSDDSFQIVGVVKNTVNWSVTSELLPEIYVPYTITGRADRVVLLTRMDPSALANTARSQVYAVDKDQPVMDVRTIERLLNDWQFSGPRFNLVLFSVFAGLGLALAVIGVYGVMSNAVAQQTHEIGVRIALGAGVGSIIGMVVGKGLRLLATGIALGLVASFFAARLLSRQLWNVSPFDPVSFAAVSALLLVVGLQACFWPARRAARIDPVRALRYE